MAKSNGIDFSGYFTLSDETIVRTMIENRNKLDPTFSSSSSDMGILDVSAYGSLDEDAICAYIDLDRIIEEADLSKSERVAIDGLMSGYMLSDIAERHNSIRQTYNKFYSRAVKKICQRAIDQWDEYHGSALARQNPRLLVE